jgi:hypothetical protein
VIRGVGMGVGQQYLHGQKSPAVPKRRGGEGSVSSRGDERESVRRNWKLWKTSQSKRETRVVERGQLLHCGPRVRQ